jgi:hypothetical protein
MNLEGSKKKKRNRVPFSSTMGMAEYPVSAKRLKMSMRRVPSGRVTIFENVPIFRSALPSSVALETREREREIVL